MSRTFGRLSREEALRYCQYLEDVGLLRLAELAWWMHDAGADVEKVTATLQGADALWEWFLEFLDTGLPGLPADAVPTGLVFDDDVRGGETQHWGDREKYPLWIAEESLQPYVRAVLANYFGAGKWVPHPASSVYFNRQAPYVFGEGWADSCLVGDFGQIKSTPTQSYRKVSFLSDSLTARHPRLASSVPASTEPVLVRFLSEPRPTWDDPRRWPPKFGYRPEPKDPMEKFLDPEVNVGEFGIVSSATRDVSDEAVMAPLDADKVAQALEAFGFTTRDRVPATGEQLRAGEVELANTAGFAQVETMAHAGQLVAVWVEPIYPDHRGWKRLMPRFTKLARELGGRIHRDIDA